MLKNTARNTSTIKDAVMCGWSCLSHASRVLLRTLALNMDGKVLGRRKEN
jgi:hypothetical protein